MRLGFVMVAAIMAGTPLRAQQPQPSTAERSESTPKDVQAEAAPPSPTAPALPISIERIRTGLATPAPPLLLRFNKVADFRTAVREQQRLNEIISSLDFKSGPVPPGGLYAYEQQRLIWNPVDHPLMQPYAAFNGGELITLAIENIIRTYLSRQVMDAITTAKRSHDEAAAKAEVARAIADYCAAQPNSGAGILICDNPSIAR
jgi:hypothetical protein